MQTDIILLHPQHAGNIGFAARAMKTMGFERLVIISEHTVDLEAAKITATDAADVLEKAKNRKSLSEILPDYHFLAAFTARRRYFRNRIRLPELPEMLSRQSAKSKIGLVFGRESSGLTNEEINACQCVVTIPTGNAFHSLNLSHAVQVACYELVRGGWPKSQVMKKADSSQKSHATAMEREAIFEKLSKVTEKIGFNLLDAGKISKIFRLLIEERSLEKREAGALHRFLDQILHAKPVRERPKTEGLCCPGKAFARKLK